MKESDDAAAVELAAAFADAAAGRDADLATLADLDAAALAELEGWADQPDPASDGIECDTDTVTDDDYGHSHGR